VSASDVLLSAVTVACVLASGGVAVVAWVRRDRPRRVRISVAGATGRYVLTVRGPNVSAKQVADTVAQALERATEQTPTVGVATRATAQSPTPGMNAEAERTPGADSDDLPGHDAGAGERERASVSDVERLHQGSQDLRGAQLAEVDLSGEDLEGVDLTEAVLTDAILIGTRFGTTILNGADLQRANLAGAQLGRALAGVDLRDADLRDALATEANLRGAKLSRANLAGADLTGADLSGADLGFAVTAGLHLGGVRWTTETQWGDLYEEVERRSDETTVAGVYRVRPETRSAAEQLIE
jgi:hypothetical protein